MYSGEKLGQALAEAIEKKGVKKAEVSRAFGIKQPSLSDWIKSGRIGKQHIQKMLEYFSDVVEPSHFGIKNMGLINSNNQNKPRFDEISDIHKPMLWSSSTPLPEDDYMFTPFLKESEFTGGGGSFEIPDYNGFRLPFGKSTLYRKGIQPDKVFCCTLNGNSMEPRIAEDAAIAIDTGVEGIKDGKIYAFQHDDLFRVKYLYRLPGGRIRIHSENENEYSDEIVNGEEIRLIGRVFWWSVLD